MCVPVCACAVCLLDHASCGCCLMQTQIERMEWFFNITTEEMNKELTKSKMALDNMRGETPVSHTNRQCRSSSKCLKELIRFLYLQPDYFFLSAFPASRSAFSVALTTDNMVRNCYNPFRTDHIIVYKHIFINLGDGYNVETGIFTAPRSGVYSLALTIYSDGGLFGIFSTCANLQVNGQAVYTLHEQNGLDLEDSATVVMAMKLLAGDQVAVSLPRGCIICDNGNHYNTFTGFLLYATD